MNTLAAIVMSAAAQQPLEPYRAWPLSERDAAGAVETRIRNEFSAEKLREWHTLLASEPHVAGTPGDARTVGRIASTFTSFGLRVERHDILPLLAQLVESRIEVISPEHRVLALAERAVDEDPYSAHPQLTGGWNAFSGSGDVTAEVVYVNYGRKEDFEALAAAGVDLTGRIAIARYGGNFRGYKAKFAEAAGAAGLIIFSDPADSGYVKGIPYPEGGWANDSCIERGSLLTLPYTGDPLTPGHAATADAPRLDPETISLPMIPVHPVSWGAAVEIMKRMKGAAVPAGWQGGLPLAYRVSGGPELTVRLRVQQKRAILPTANIVGELPGAEEPERLVIVGCHHDAWGFGAADPLAGGIAMIECARVLSALAADGVRPRRTILFCAWGAEEFGIIGSTEWVEANRERLERSGVAYINLDMASMGPNLGAASAPNMRLLLAESAAVTPQARRAEAFAITDWLSRGVAPGSPALPIFGDIGGGSDHVGFWCHAVIPAAGLSGTGAPGNSYHSTYDNLAWYRKVVGDDYEPALMIGRMTAAAIYRLAYAPLIPLDPTRTGAAVATATDAWAARAASRGLSDAGAADAMARLASAARTIDAPISDAYGAAHAAFAAGSMTMAQLGALNAALTSDVAAFRLKDGLPDRPWYRSAFASPDPDSGYAAWMLPLLGRAVEDGDAAEVVGACAAYEEMLKNVASVGPAIHAAAQNNGPGM